MKRNLIYLLAAIMLCAVGCNESYDDSALVGRVESLESRVAKLEELCKQMNTNISSLQSLVNALQNNDYVTGVTPITKDGETVGYTITFAKSQPITIYNGTDGKDGQNGADGKDGVDGENGTDGMDGIDGHTPIIGVKQDADGIYYWILDGDWLLDDKGDKIKAKGVDGEDGNDGITPKLKIEDGYWYISYDNEVSWEQLGVAIEDNGSIFQEVYIEDGYACFVVDGNVLKISYLSNEVLVFVSECEGDVKTKLTNQQKRTITHLIVEGVLASSDVRYIADQMLALEILDLRKTNLSEVSDYAFCKGGLKYGKESLREVYLPETCTSIGDYAFYGCINLGLIEAKGDVVFAKSSLLYCKNISLYIGSSTFIGYSKSHTKIDTLCFCGTAIKNIEDVTIDHMIVNNSIVSIQGVDTGYYESLSINTVEFEEPASISSIDMGFLSDIKELTIPTSIKIMENYETLIFRGSLKKIIIPQNSQLEKWELDSDYTNYLEEIYCYLPTPPVLTFSSNYKFSPIVYVPFEYYSAYATSAEWSKFTIKAIM